MSAFGSKMLEKWGWQAGKGLGKNEDGVKDYIRVKKKHDNAGLGVTGQAPAANWWEKLYNSTAKSTKVKASKKAVSPEASSDSDSDARTPPDSPLPPPSDPAAAPTALSGRFVSNGDFSQQPMVDTSDDDHEPTPDDAELFAACGGATFGKFTGHFRPEGKFKRIQQQEAKFRALQQQAKHQPAAGDQAKAKRRKSHKSGDIVDAVTQQPEAAQVDTQDDTDRKKKKKKKKQQQQQEVEHNDDADDKQQVAPAEPADKISKKKKRKSAAVDAPNDEAHGEEQVEPSSKPTKRKRGDDPQDQHDDPQDQQAAEQEQPVAVKNKPKRHSKADK